MLDDLPAMSGETSESHVEETDWGPDTAMRIGDQSFLPRMAGITSSTCVCSLGHFSTRRAPFVSRNGFTSRRVVNEDPFFAKAVLDRMVELDELEELGVRAAIYKVYARPA